MSDREVSARITAKNETAAGIGEAKASIESLGSATAGTAAKMKESFAGVSASVRVMGVNIRESFAAMTEMRELLVGFGEAAIAAFAVEKVADWTREMGESAEKTTHLAQTFGLTVAQVQQLSGVAKMTGISVETLTKGMGIFDKNMIASAGHTNLQGQALKAVGITSVTSATQMQLLIKVADKFKGMEDGPRKVALAMALFGKSGKDLIPVLNQGGAAIKEIADETIAYGGVNEVAVAKGYALAESVNTSKLAMQGLGNVLTDAFAPMLKVATDNMNSLIHALVDSYNSGGMARQGLDFVSGALGVLGEIITQTVGLIGQLARDFGTATESMAAEGRDAFGHVIPKGMSETQIEMNKLKGLVTELALIVRITFAEMGQWVDDFAAHMQRDFTVIYDAMFMNWDAAASDWKAGTARIVKINADATSNIRAMWNSLLAADALAASGIPANDGSMHTNAKKKDPPSEPGFSPSGGGHPKKGGGHHKDSGEMQQWRQELAEKLALEVNWGVDEAKFTRDFWKAKVDAAKGGAKALKEADAERARAELAVHKEVQAETIADIKAGETRKLDSVKADMALERQALQESLARIDARQAAGKITNTQAVAEKAAVSRELYQLEADELEAEHKIHVEAFNAQLLLEHLKKTQIDEIKRQQLVEETQFQNKLRVLSGQTAQKEMADQRAVAAAQRAMWNQTFNGFAQNISKLVTLQQGFAATFKGIWQSMQSIAAQAISNIVRNFLVGLAMQETAHKAANQKSVLRDAMAAARGAYKAIVGIPVVGPILAPIAAATAFTAVEAFTAEGGYDVPGMSGPGIDGRGGQIGIVHPREMVLPADLADKVRGGSAGGGDIHIHAVDAQSVRRLFENHRGALADAMRKHQRMGGRA